MHDIMAKDILFPLLALIGALVPIARMIWSLSQLDSRVTRNSEDINHIGEKLNKRIDQTDERNNEYERELASIRETMVRIETKLDTLLDK